MIYVLAGASGGDGSASAPFGTIRDATDVARATSVVAIGRGRYDEVVPLAEGVTLQGACAAQTVLTSASVSETAGTISVDGGATVVRDLSLDRPARAGVFAFGTSREVDLTGVAISRAIAGAVVVAGGARVTAEALAVSGTRPRPSDLAFGLGLNVEGRAQARIRRAVFDANHNTGVLAIGDGTMVDLAEVAIRGTEREVATGDFGFGLSPAVGGHAEMRSGIFERNQGNQVLASSNATVLLEDVVALDGGCCTGDATSGRGIEVHSGSSGEVRRARLERNRELALAVAGDGVRAVLEHLVVRDTLSRDRDGEYGRGIEIDQGAEVDLRWASFERNTDIGVLITQDGTSAVLQDLVVNETRSRDGDGVTGHGIHVQDGATARVLRARLEGNRHLGVQAFGRATTVDLQELVVDGTLAQACAADACPDESLGVALGAVEATLEARRFVFTDSALCGIFLALDAQVDLSEGLVSENPIGVCLQIEGYDTNRLTSEVRYRDNATNLDSTSLPIPDPAVPAG